MSGVGKALKNGTMIIALVIGAGMTPPAEASIIDGNKLLDRCTSRDLGWSTWCAGDITEIADAMAGGVSLLGWRSCIPTGLNSGSVWDVALRQKNKTPQNSRKSAHDFVAIALEKAWRCRK